MTNLITTAALTFLHFFTGGMLLVYSFNHMTYNGVGMLLGLTVMLLWTMRGGYSYGNPEDDE